MSVSIFDNSFIDIYLSNNLINLFGTYIILEDLIKLFVGKLERIFSSLLYLTSLLSV